MSTTWGSSSPKLPDKLRRSAAKHLRSMTWTPLKPCNHETSDLPTSAGFCWTVLSPPIFLFNWPISSLFAVHSRFSGLGRCSSFYWKRHPFQIRKLLEFDSTWSLDSFEHLGWSLEKFAGEVYQQHEGHINDDGDACRQIFFSKTSATFVAPLWETNISPKKWHFEDDFPFPMWDMLIPWRVSQISLSKASFVILSIRTIKVQESEWNMSCSLTYSKVFVRLSSIKKIWPPIV